ncbi:MAG: polyribonucleotide nucleotidyltransferase [Lentisphaerae bacterium]|nr:polyribonucleotide nucleotidyltransferase [Lentisphaerota bacterium]
MKNTTSVDIQVGNKRMLIETGLLAQQAHGAVTIRLGDTLLFSAVTATETPREGIDYFPLQVEYREKFYAAGRFPGGFFKREARPSEKEILTARFTDRPIRALFADGYHNDVQINNMLLSADGENDPDILSIVAASAALTLSELPFFGPIGAVRIGRLNGEWIVNPTNAERDQSDLDLIYTATRELPVMIEGGAQEIKEADLVAAMKFAHGICVAIIDAQLELRRKLGLPDKTVRDFPTDTQLLESARAAAQDDMKAALTIAGKQDRRKRISEIRESLKIKLGEKFPEMTAEEFRAMFDQFEIMTVRRLALDQKRRVDGRGFDDLRPLAGQVGFLPRTHGSAIFARGETQALASVTLGSQKDMQSMDAITGGPNKKQFMLHYNFPPYSVGEVGRLGSTGRREIGHGALAERSILEMLPEDYLYTVRLVSDIMSSNGSTSMATVCAGTLALMDAGVPLQKPVAGISIGLIAEGQTAHLLTDILGDEDHCGDMDFKVAGTRDGITGFQVDLKIRGLAWDLVAGAFEKARIARLKILDFMGTIIAAPRADLSPFAPRVQAIKINPENIGDLIGPGGKNIRRITEITGAQIDIDDDGTVNIFSPNKESIEMAIREISMVTAEPEVDAIYNGTVVGIKEFGCFVEIFPGTDGLVHISELADFRVNRVEDICKMGDQMWVKCIGVDDRGRVKLSRRAALKDRDAAAAAPAPAAPPK